MATLDADLSLDEASALHDGLAHPARVAAMRVLRKAGRLPVADLRREVVVLVRDVALRVRPAPG